MSAAAARRRAATACSRARGRRTRGPVGPCSTATPSRSTMTSSHRYLTTPRSWDTSTSVSSYSSASRRRRSRICTRTETSSALTGSSPTSSFGPGAMARAMATRCCWPPESSCGYRRPPRRIEPDRLEHLGDPRVVVARHVEAHERLADHRRRSSCAGSSELSGSCRTICASRRNQRIGRGRPGRDRLAAVGDRARRRPVEPEQDPHERRLARARLADDAEAAALGDRHVDAVEGDPLGSPSEHRRCAAAGTRAGSPSRQQRRRHGATPSYDVRRAASSSWRV